MIKAIQQKLRETSILDNSDLILSVIQVIDLLKKEKSHKTAKPMKEEFLALIPSNKYFLIATIKRANNDKTPYVYLVKSNDKVNEIKLKLTWHLNELKTVTQSKDNCQFEVQFYDNTKSLYQCETLKDRDEFLETLWKLSEEFLKQIERPKFVNVTRNESDSTDLASRGVESERGAGQTNQFEMSKGEEDSLLRLMSECDFASANAESFMNKLKDELLYLDTSNIESIMNSEENTLRLIEMLDTAVDEVDNLDNRLAEYESKISAVGDAVRIVGERDNVIQLQQNNQHALLDLLDSMVQLLDFPPTSVRLLSDCDLSSSVRVNACSQAANQLLDVLETEMAPGLKRLRAYEEQFATLERLKLKFCNGLYQHLKNAIGYATNKHLESYKVIDNSLNALPPHKQIHDDLSVYNQLTPWMHRSRCFFNDHDHRRTYFDDIRQNYVETVRQLYLLEIVPFCNCARNRINTSSERPKATASMENLRLFRGGDKANPGDQFIVRIDLATKDTLKLVLTKLLNQLSMSVQCEQTFCQDFFNIRTPDTVSDASSLNSSGMKQSLNTSQSQQNDSSKNDLLILRDIFTNLIEDQVKLVMESITKTEPMMVLFLYSDLLFRVLVSHNNSQFMHQPLVSLLRSAKLKCDEYVRSLIDSIRDCKINRREKIGLLKYVVYFEEFMKEAEKSWEPIKADMYEKLCIIYQSIVNEVYKGIELVSSESQKTPPDVVRFQNYHQMHHILRSINGLKESTNYARDQYILYKASYIKEHFGRPLEKLHNFFEKVDAKIERGYKPEDISYQLDLSADNLREIIKEFPAKEVKKGLETLYLKVEKHLADRSSLLEVVWRDMSHEFIRQYKNYENLIKTCYPGHKITFEFTEADICEFFQVETKETRFKKVKPIIDLVQLPESDTTPTPVFVKLPSVSIEETSSPTPPPTPAISAVMENSKPHFATVTFAQTPPEQIDTPLIEKEPEPYVEEAQLTKTKKPFKVQYFKDEKSLQFSIDLKTQKKADTGCLSQLKFKSFYQACFGEFLGTYVLVLFAVGFGMNADKNDTSAGLTGALVTGLLIATLVWGLAQVSGCNINPAVSLALLVSGDTNIIRVLFYVPCQLLGSCLAIVSLRGIMIDQSVPEEIQSVNNTQVHVPAVLPQIGLTLLNPSISPMQGIFVEVLITFVLIITIFACVDAHRKDLGGSFPLTIGFAVTVGALMGGKFTGGSMNPARSFGPAFVQGNMHNHYIYWVGPSLGAVLGAITYKLLTFKTSVSVVKSRK